MTGGPDFGILGTKFCSGVQRQSLVRSQKQNLNFKLTKHRKAIFHIYAVHMHSHFLFVLRILKIDLAIFVHFTCYFVHLKHTNSYFKMRMSSTQFNAVSADHWCGLMDYQCIASLLSACAGKQTVFKTCKHGRRWIACWRMASQNLLILLLATCISLSCQRVIYLRTVYYRPEY